MALFSLSGGAAGAGGGGAGTGDVVGPASATDNAIARYDSTTGKLLQNSAVAIDDAGAVAGVSDLDASGDITGQALFIGSAFAVDAAGVVSNASIAAAQLTGSVAVSNGGTGAATLAAHGVVIGNGTGAVAVTGAGTAGQVLTSNGASADPTFQAAAGGIGGSTGATDNRVLRADGTGGATLQNSAVAIDDAGAVSGVTQLDVDNVRVDGNTISSTNSNGNINLTPNGTGLVVVPDGTSSALGLAFAGQTTTGFYRRADSVVTLRAASGTIADFSQGFGIALTAATQMKWSAGDAATVAADWGFVRTGIGVGRVTNASTGLGSLLTARLVEANTAGSGSPNILAANESRTLLTNEGATAENYHTLPTAVAGYEFIFYCQDTDGIRVVANTGDTIRLGASVSASAGFVRSVAAGSCITIVAINATEWVATSIVGTWTIDV